MTRTIGLLGGGQLGQMLCEAANPLGITVKILDVGHSPAKKVNAYTDHLDGSFKDAEKIRELAKSCDVLTVEIEHVDTEILEELDGTVEIQPSWRTLRTIQDKYLQKKHLIDAGVDVAESVSVDSTAADLERVGAELGFPYMLKARKDAYDGRGNFPVMTQADIPEALGVLNDRGLYAERWASFKMELAVMVVKTENDTGDIASTIAYPAVETIHEDSICKLVYAPARNVSANVREKAQLLARKAIASLWGKGVFGCELFLMSDDSLVINEIAPRPHNSGHYTIEACPTMSQYKSQLLSILGEMPAFKGNTIPMKTPASIMLNILGGAKESSHLELVKAAKAIPDAALHMYGKDSKPARKIGHITLIADVHETMPSLESQALPLIKLASHMRSERLPKAKPSPIPSAPQIQPLVAVRMGSDSDLKTLEAGCLILEKFNIPFDVDITSAHRTPHRMTQFAESAASKGYKVIIAAAGGAAHLPGMIASETKLPVIGVPVKASVLDGVDSLYSIVQMPRGIPCLTVGVGNSTNAALGAIRILALQDSDLSARYEKYIQTMADEVEVKAEKIMSLGWENYKKSMA